MADAGMKRPGRNRQSTHLIGRTCRYRIDIKQGKRGYQAEMRFLDLPLTLRFHSAEAALNLARSLHGLVEDMLDRMRLSAAGGDDDPF